MRVKHHAKGYKALMLSPGAWADVGQRAQSIADACNAQSSWGGYRSGVEKGNKRRASANVWSISKNADIDNARNNRMIRALDAGR